MSNSRENRTAVGCLHNAVFLRSSDFCRQFFEPPCDVTNWQLTANCVKVVNRFQVFVCLFVVNNNNNNNNNNNTVTRLWAGQTGVPFTEVARLSYLPAQADSIWGPTQPPRCVL